MNEHLAEISDLVAEAVNSESFDSLEEELGKIFPDLTEEQRKAALGMAWLTYVIASQPGCLPDSWAAYPMSADEADIREEIVSMMGGDNFDEDETDWESVRQEVDALDLSGDSIDAPDGQIIDVFRKSCAEVIEENGI